MENNISFNYLNLHTSYLFNVKRVVGDSEKLLDPIKSFKGRPTHLPCFANLFGFLSNEFDTKEKLNVSLGIFINADIKLVRDGRKNNLVVVNKDTIIRHLDYAKRMFDFEYQLNKRKNYYLRIQMIGNSIQVKFLCAWVRYLYEYPANVLMSDIYQLIDAGKFTDESIFNLIMALNSTLNYRQIRNDQCIFVWGKFQEEDELRKKLKRGSSYLSNLYSRLDGLQKYRLKTKSAEEETKYDFLLDEDNLADRYMIYEKAVKYYKEKRQ